MTITGKILIINSISLSKKEIFRISRTVKFNISYISLSQLFSNRVFRQRIVDSMVDPIKILLSQNSISKKIIMSGPRYKNIKMNLPGKK